MTVELLHGDCVELMRAMSDASVDAIVTDPPYGLGFMGKAWDALPPGLEWAQECLRVLKPGGHLLAFGGTRTWHRLAVAIEDAGFELRDSIAWMHGQGFPKGRAQLKPAHEPVVMARKRPIAAGTGRLNIDAARTEEGRWPANVILDESTAILLDAQSGYLHGSGNKTDTEGGAAAGYGASSYEVAYQGRANRDYGSAGGGASRFFYVAKASRKERPGGVAHPTVKPLMLMRHLVRLVTPGGGTILDPFAGSGTTMEAAILEGFNAIGMEREADYLPLIEQRIERCGLLS